MPFNMIVKGSGEIFVCRCSETFTHVHSIPFCYPHVFSNQKPAVITLPFHGRPTSNTILSEALQQVEH